MSESLREKLAGEVLRDVAFDALVPQLVQEVVFQVAEIPLVDVGVALARDEGEEVKGWLESGQLARPLKETLKRWEEEDQRFVLLIVQPFVLVQEEVPKVGGVERIHWDVVESKEEELLSAIWPAPVDHDACFVQAGFAELAESDEAWDAEFQAMAAALVDRLRHHGAPALRGDRTGEDVVAALVDAATWDSAPRAVVSFGAFVELAAGQGHPIFWLTVRKGATVSFEELLRAVAGSRRVDQTTLEWSVLRPS